jgi:hypothetical protein
MDEPIPSIMNAYWASAIRNKRLLYPVAVTGLAWIVTVAVFGSGQVVVLRGEQAVTIKFSASSSAHLVTLGLFAMAIAVFCGRMIKDPAMEAPGFSLLQRSVSVLVGLCAIGILFIAPSTLSHRVVVTQKSISHRAGFWFSPSETRIDLGELKALRLERMLESAESSKQELVCLGKSGQEIGRIPFTI